MLDLPKCKGFDYQSLASAINAGSEVVQRIDSSVTPSPIDMADSIMEIVEAVRLDDTPKFRPRFDPPPNT